jgi:bacitracin synthase 3
MSAEERKQVLYDFNDTEREYPVDKTIHQLFAEQAERTPHRVAAVGSPSGVRTKHRFIASESRKIYITYDLLNEKSNQLSYLLKEQGVVSDTIVPIMAERSVEMIIGILAF